MYILYILTVQYRSSKPKNYVSFDWLDEGYLLRCMSEIEMRDARCEMRDARADRTDANCQLQLLQKRNNFFVVLDDKSREC